MEYVTSLIQSIPGVIWAALLGSMLTLFGVVLTNRHHRVVHRTQLEHESRENDKRRKFEKRAEVYLAAAGEMVKAQQVLGDLSNLDFSKNNVGTLLSGFTSSANQAALIASDETAEAINEFLTAYFTAFFRLLPLVFPILDAKVDRDIQDRMYEAAQSEVARILATMTHVNETQSYSAVDWDTLNRNLEFNQVRAKETADLRSKAWDEINRLNVEYLDQVMSHGKLVARAALPALVAIRSDLNISTDIDMYGAQLERRLGLMDHLLRELKESIQKAAT